MSTFASPLSHPCHLMSASKKGVYWSLTKHAASKRSDASPQGRDKKVVVSPHVAVVCTGDVLNLTAWRERRE